MEKLLPDMKPVKMITSEIFKQRVGRDPENDDLDRCNCNKLGLGHMFCGWCETCNMPRFICGHGHT